MLFVLLAAAACGGNDGPTAAKAADIKLNLTQVSIDQKDSVQIIPSVVDASGTLLAGVPVTFVSSAANVVTVSNVGMVTSVGPAGSATIQVKAAGLVRSVAVVVRGVATTLVVNPSPGTLPQKGTLQLVPQLLDRVSAPLPNAEFAFESAAPSIVTVSSAGLVTSVGPAGLAGITVRSGAFATVVQVAVTQVATRIDASPSPALVTVNRTRQLTVRLLDAVDAEIKGAAFTYTSSAPSVVTVAADGTITSVGPLSTATITIRAQGTPLTKDIPISVVSFGHPEGTARAIAVGGGTYAVAIMSESEAYVSNLGGVVSRVDLATGLATAIPGSHGGLTLAASRTMQEVYSSLYEGSSIEIISTAGTPSVVGSIQLNGHVIDLVIGPDDRTAYASVNNGSIAIIDLATRTVTPVMTGLAFLHIALHPTKKIIYGGGNSQIVYEVDLTTRVTRQFIGPGGFYGQASAVTSDAAFLYVASETGSVEEFSIATGQRVRSFSTCSAWGLRLSPDDDRLIVACSSGQAMLLERSTGRVVQTFPSGGARRVAISRDGFTALIGSASGGATLIR